MLRLNFNLEHPFAWKVDGYPLEKWIKHFPTNFKPTISFKATRASKVIGYLPIIGTIIGIFHVFKGIHEYRLLNKHHLHHLSKRSVKWIIRGTLECLPILGGMGCAIADIACTLIGHKTTSFSEDETPCGYCHQCGYCACPKSSFS
ncbi:MAG: hypothetical protein ACSNEK_07960 [Parachlamydiaceae bacterium]